MGRYEKVQINIGSTDIPAFEDVRRHGTWVGLDKFGEYLPDPVIAALWAEYGKPDAMYDEPYAFEENGDEFYGNILAWRTREFAITYERYFAA